VVKMDTKRRLERIFEIASLKCCKCDDLHPDLHLYGISTLEEWKKEMDITHQWIVKNSAEVLSTLPLLEHEWKESCKSIRLLIQRSKQQEQSKRVL